MFCGKCGKSCGGHMCFCPVSFGLAAGIVVGIYMAAFAWSVWLWGHGVAIIEQYGDFFIGYAPSFWGGVIGGLWGFAEGFVFGLIFAWIYNLIIKCCKRSDKACTCDEAEGKKQ